jgi:serine/threonine-protein kinase
MLDVIGRLYTALGEYDRARPLLEEALATRRRLYGNNPPDVATSLGNLADVVHNKQELAEAVRLRREVLDLRRRLGGPDDPKSLDALYWLAFSTHQAQDSAAWPLFEEWIAATAKQPRALTGARASQLTAGASIVDSRGDKGLAETMLLEALAIRREVYGPQHYVVAATLTDIGELYTRTGRRAEAESLLAEAVPLLRIAWPDGHPMLASTLRAWALNLSFRGRNAEAVAPLREVLALQERFSGPQSIDFAVANLDLANELIATGSYGDAEMHARRGAKLLREEMGPSNAMAVYADIMVGDALRGQKRYAEAEPLLIAGYERFKTPRPMTANWRRLALGALARFHEVQGRPEEGAKYRGMMDAPAAPPAPPGR